jgi:hypothetical protein
MIRTGTASQASGRGRATSRGVGRDGYTLVTAEGSLGYIAPHAPACPPDERYMAVRRVQGGGWAIVDRRSGRLFEDDRPGGTSYETWSDVQAAVRSLNTPAPSASAS